MECKDSSYRRKRPLAPILTPNRIRLITGKLSLSVLCLREKLAKLEWPLRAQSQGIKLRFQLLPMQQDLTLHNENWLNGTAKLIQLIFNIVAGAARMALNTVSNRLRGSNYGFFIRALHLLEGLKYRSKEFLLPQCLRLILVWFFLRVYSRSLSLTKSIHKAVKAKIFTELFPHQLQPIRKMFLVQC